MMITSKHLNQYLPTFRPQLSTLLLSNSFAVLNLKKVGRTMIADLPQSQLPVRKYEDFDDQPFGKKDAYQMFQYRKGDRPGRCMYYTLQRKGRIYHVYNAYYYPLGRMIARISGAIRGRNSPHYRNSMSQPQHGDICVIVNIEDPLLTGKKLKVKNLKYHTGFIGHLRTHSYRAVLNSKPQLGPTHNIPFLPQFAPDKNIYEYLPYANLLDVMKTRDDVRLVEESQPGLADKILGKKVEPYFTERDKRMLQQQKPQNAQDIKQLYEIFPQTRKVSTITPRKLKAMKSREKQVEQRYRRLSAPYRPKNNEDKGFEYFESEKKARKHPKYDILANEQMEEDDEIPVCPDPFEPAPKKFPWEQEMLQKINKQKKK